MGFYFNQGDRPLSGYTIQRGVGRGAFGEVYYATSDGGKEVALKYLRDNPQIELRGVSHCLNLKSPYLIDLHDIKQNADGEHFVVMEYVNGASLRDLLNSEPQGLGPQKAAYFLRELCKGMTHLHDRGIVHRDLKPGNIFYEDGYVKIGDYGLAKMMSTSQHSGQTMSIGTVHYMAPEIGSGNYDRTIDIYALGVILYEMLLGRVPFSGATMGEVLMKHLTAQPEVDDLPEPFPAVIRKALAKNPDDRYQTANEMMEAVFEVEELGRSVAAFQPASLTTIAAHVAEDIHVTPIAKPVQGGGGVAIGTGSSNVGQGVPPPVINPAVDFRSPGGGHGENQRFAGGRGGRRGGRSGSRFGRIHARMSEPVARVANRIDNSEIGRQVAEAGGRPAHWLERSVVAVAMCAGLSFGVSIITDAGSDTAVTVFFEILALVAGVILGGRLVEDRLKMAGGLASRLLVGCCVAAGLMIVVAIASANGDWQADERVMPLLLSLLLCDWLERFRMGRKGKVCLGSAFSVGIFGFFAGVILVDGPGNGLLTAAVLAAASLAIQGLAVLWPPRAVPIGRASGTSDGAEDAAGQQEPGVPGTVGVAVAPAGMSSMNRGTEGFAGDVAQLPAIPRIRRSTAARVLWTAVAALSLLTMVMLFVSAGILKLHEDDFAGLIVGGIATANCFLLAIWCAIPRYKSGLWRGIFRKAIFFAGTALCATCGASIRLFNVHDHSDEFLALLGCIIGGGIISLFVWLIPIPRYDPIGATEAEKPEEDEAILEQRKGVKLMRVGGGLLAVAMVLLVTLLAALSNRDYDEVIPPAVIPLSTVAMLFLLVGYMKRRPAKPIVKKLMLPLRRVFEIAETPNVGRIIERHLTMVGYAVHSRSDHAWSFTRGNPVSSLVGSNIRQWRTTLNLALYELDDGGFRVSCYLDVPSILVKPDAKHLATLDAELADLRSLLHGQEVVNESAQEGLA